MPIDVHKGFPGDDWRNACVNTLVNVERVVLIYPIPNDDGCEILLDRPMEDMKTAVIRTPMSLDQVENALASDRDSYQVNTSSIQWFEQ